MNKKERATRLFAEGYVCSQAVLAVYAELFGLTYESAIKVASAFGGGLARKAEVCGAITGALMVIGLMHGSTDLEDSESKEKTYAISQELMRRFEEKLGSIKCRSLLGVDISNQEGLENARENKLFETVCPDYIRMSIEVLEELL